MAKYSHIGRGGVGAPVGLTVFKTAGGSLGAVPGGFDSHTPLPIETSTVVCAVYLQRNSSKITRQSPLSPSIMVL
jgi:hypothetical protein